MMAQITIDVSDNNECTAYPWWVIIDPQKMMSPSIDAVASMITGPFFSREAADDHLKWKQHHYSKRARVYCHSGHRSAEYIRAFREARAAEQAEAS